MDKTSLRAVVLPRLGIDPRALAAFRIAVGLVLLINLLVYRLPNLTPFYTDSGVFPRSLLAETHPLFARFSLHALSGALWWQGLLLALAAVAALALLVGYRTTLATGISFLLLASLYARNPFVLNGGDSILLTFLFFGLFLPLDKRWALGGTRDESSDRRILSLATAFFLVNFTTIYTVNSLLKYQSDAWMAGTAVPRVFHVEGYIVRLGPYFAEFTSLLTGVNWSWIILLSLAPLLLLVTGWARIALVAGFMSAQLGMALTMRLGVFPLVMIAALLTFLPPRAWDPVESIVRNSDLATTARTYGGTVDHTPPRLFHRVPSIVRRGVHVGGTLVLVLGFTSLLVWQGAGTGLVEAPADNLDGALANAGWSFFAPHPPDTAGWYLVEADSVTMTLGGQEITSDRPPDIAGSYPSTLWHRYGNELPFASDRHQKLVAEYACANAGEDVDSVTLYYVEQPVDANGPNGELTRYRLAETTCPSPT